MLVGLGLINGYAQRDELIIYTEANSQGQEPIRGSRFIIKLITYFIFMLIMLSLILLLVVVYKNLILAENINFSRLF